MNAGRSLAGIAAQFIRDFLVFAPRHRSALRRAYYDRIILVAVHELAYDYRADVRITEYTIAHVITAKKRRDDFSVW